MKNAQLIDSFISSSPKEAAERIALLGQLGGKWTVYKNHAYVLEVPEAGCTAIPFRIISLYGWNIWTPERPGLVTFETVPVAVGRDGLAIIPQIEGK